jgi:hypothetical protein
MKVTWILHSGKSRTKIDYTDICRFSHGFEHIRSIQEKLKDFECDRTQLTRPKPGIMRWPSYSYDIPTFIEIRVDVPGLKGKLP